MAGRKTDAVAEVLKIILLFVMAGLRPGHPRLTDF
jgi:hypothetical protein